MNLLRQRKTRGCPNPNYSFPVWERLLFGRIEICWMGWPWRMMNHPSFRKPKRLWHGSPDFHFKVSYVNIDFPCLHLGGLVLGWCGNSYRRDVTWDTSRDRRT